MQNLQVIRCPDSVSQGGALFNPWKATEACKQSERDGRVCRRMLQTLQNQFVGQHLLTVSVGESWKLYVSRAGIASQKGAVLVNDSCGCATTTR